MDELMKKEDEKQKFQDQEAKMRKTTIELLHSAEGILILLYLLLPLLLLLL
jgi:hypothetical protein